MSQPADPSAPDDKPPPKAPAMNGWKPPPTETDLLAEKLNIRWLDAARITREQRGMKSSNKVVRFAQRRA